MRTSFRLALLLFVVALFAGALHEVGHDASEHEDTALCVLCRPLVACDAIEPGPESVALQDFAGMAAVEPEYAPAAWERAPHLGRGPPAVV